MRCHYAKKANMCEHYKELKMFQNRAPSRQTAKRVLKSTNCTVNNRELRQIEHMVAVTVLARSVTIETCSKFLEKHEEIFRSLSFKYNGITSCNHGNRKRYPVIWSFSVQTMHVCNIEQFNKTLHPRAKGARIGQKC